LSSSWFYFRNESTSSIPGTTSDHPESLPENTEAHEASTIASAPETAESETPGSPIPAIGSGPVHLKLRILVTETVNAVISSSGQVSKMLVVGEVGLALDDAPLPSSLSRPGQFNLFFRDVDAIDKVVPNTSFCSPADGEDSRSFACDLGEILAYAPSEASALPLLKYQVRVVDGEYDKFAPLSVRTRWKPEHNQTSLMLLYQFNPEGSSLASSTLAGVDMLVSIAGSADVANVQCKPNGPWNKDRRMLLWRLGDLEPSTGEPGKLIARFETGVSPVAEQSESQGEDMPSVQLPPGPINVRFSCIGALLSGANVGAGISADNGELATVEIVEVRKQVVAGTYVVLP
jgi:hypothetical protein